MNALLKMLQDQKRQLKIENQILKNLALYHAVGEIKLLTLIGLKDDNESLGLYNKAIKNLFYKNLIDIVSDKENRMSVVREKHVCH